MAGRAGAVTGASPGVTRSVSSRPLLVRAAPPLYVYDSPGVLAPGAPSMEQGIKLALTHAVRDAEGAVPATVLADYIVWVAAGVPGGLARLAGSLGLPPASRPADGAGFLTELAGKLGSRLPGGGLDEGSAARHLLAAWREGRCGRWTLD